MRYRQSFRLGMDVSNDEEGRRFRCYTHSLNESARLQDQELSESLRGYASKTAALESPELNSLAQSQPLAGMIQLHLERFKCLRLCKPDARLVFIFDSHCHHTNWRKGRINENSLVGTSILSLDTGPHKKVSPVDLDDQVALQWGGKA
ncbi:uncharacterized protein H6S33_001427 [Morchella sextelata]|uniref:uncharacterized protein n=1 Tax=Morchella sextelata TaxID=1174677 RepID=UPI001D042EE0|nr:uncharacterized protein H6S33_001427 [Morchella sextelata]KAH0609199.1 hypothetical protein H6S33_001427 [Morchella sextelata]